MTRTDHPSVLRYARSFARHPELEYEDLLQVGRLAIWRAELAVGRGLYDARRASWDTYATNCVRLAMCKELSRARRHLVSTVALDEDATIDDLADAASPPPDDRAVLLSLLRALPEDARAVASLLLGDEPGAVLDGALAGARGAADALRSYLRRALGLRRGDRADAAFDALRRALEGGDRGDDYDAADRLWSALVGGGAS